jgi:capsid protein
MTQRFLSAILFAATILTMAGAPGVAGAWESAQCADTSVLKRISRKFDHQVRHVPHLPQVAIVSFETIHEHRYLPSLESRPIARRYCNATAWMTDGRKRQVWYLIETGQGLAGMGDNVEFCVAGFDRWNVYNGHCRILR